jgi:hypothetical protein
LLWNGRINNGVMQTVSRQRCGKHASTTIELRWKRCFLVGPCKWVIRKKIGDVVENRQSISGVVSLVEFCEEKNLKKFEI